MSFEPLLIIAVLVSFLIGSIPTGQIIAKKRGIDLKKIGSGNIGATNVLRALGKEAAILTLIGDIAKGATVVLIAKTLSDNNLVEGIMGLSAILGHNFSLFLSFRGGKGVATSIGVLLAYTPYTALFIITIWLLVVKRTRYSSLGALVAFGLLPLSIYILDYSKEKILVAVAITILIFIRHIANIKRLIKGTESKIGLIR